MIATFYNYYQDQYRPKFEMYRGKMVVGNDHSDRVSNIFETLKNEKKCTFNEVKKFNDEYINRVHSKDYIEFLKNT